MPVVLLGAMTFSLGLARVGVSVREPSSPAPAIAVVSSVAGQATLTEAPAKTRPLSVFEWLPVGSVVGTSPDSTITLTFVDGARYEIEGDASARLEAVGPLVLKGRFRTLPRMPPLPRLVALSPEARAGHRSAALRIRSESAPRFRFDNAIRNLYPRDPATAEAATTVLRFKPDEPATFTIEVNDELGTPVFNVETTASSVAVPPTLLRPGARYKWTASVVGPIGRVVRGEARFFTLPAEDVGRRAALRRTLDAAGDPTSLAFAAEIDWRLGLWWEARQTLSAALASAPQDPAIRRALAAVERALTSEGVASWP